MTGYVRQSAADIVPTGVVRAAPINNELNALRDAFATAGGHKHDGTAAEGHPVPVIGDSDLLNKIATDTGNNRHGVFVEVGGVAVEQVRFQDGAIVPVTDNDVDLGTSSLEFKDLHIDGTANIDSLVADTADINGGTVDGAVIGGSSAAAGSFTTIGATGAITSTVSTGTAPLVIASTTKVSNLNVDQLDGADWAAPAAIGTSTPAAGTFTSLTANTSLVAATADINGGTLDGAVIGASSAQAITGTTVTATTGFVGGLTGNVTGNTTGTHTGAVIGNVTGDVTGNVTASSGSSSFNDVVINGGLNMNAGTSATITNLTSPTNTNDAATKGYVDTSIANLIDSAPGALDTLNELAAALGDDASFSTTVTNSIATKLALAGGTMSGAIAMGTNKITGLGNPTANQDAATKTYVDTADALKLSLTGGTMSGAIAMGTSKITGLGDPTANQDAATKIYVDGILGSATSAAASAAAAAVSASNAATSESNASTSASNASTSASNAATSATNAAASYDAFDDRYLGSKASAPSVDNDGNALLTGALYWNSTSSELYLWTGSAWTRSALSGSDYVAKSGDTMTGALTTTALTLSGGTANGVAYLNGSKVLTSGSALTFDGSNLGVGVSSPTQRLETIGTLRIKSANADANGLNLSSDVGGIGYINAGYASVGAIAFQTAGTEGMRLTSTGLGIGTSSPVSPLHVVGDIRSTGDIVLVGGAGTPEVQFYQNSGNWKIAVDNDAMQFIDSSAASERMRLDSSGNLGIGTSSPATRLDIVKASTGDVATFTGTGGAKGYLNVGGTTVSIYDSSAGAGNGIIFGSSGTSAVRLQYGGTVGVTLDSAGNLGLGVTPLWAAGKGFEIGSNGNALASVNSTQTTISQNAYHNGTNWTYARTSTAVKYQQYAGTHTWQTAASGTAGNAITFTDAMTLGSDGNLLVGGTSSVIGKLEVSVTDTSASADGINIRGTQNNAYGGYLSWSDTWNGDSYRGKIAAILGYREDVGKGQLRFFTYGSSALTERARISAAGGFSVGTTANPGAGAIYATGAITAYYSDARLKTVSGKIENALDKVAKLSGVYYTNNDTAKSFGYTSDEVQVGVLAQEIEAVLPQVVKAAPFDLDEDGNSKSGQNYKTVQYDRLVPLLIEAINELQAKVKLLENK